MVDLSQLSDDELNSLETAISGADLSASALSQMSDNQLNVLERLASASKAKPWNVIDSAKQFGSGALEGIGGLVGLASDLNPLSGNWVPRLSSGENGLSASIPALEFRNSRAIQSKFDSVLPEKEDKYRYARTIGEFVGPSFLMPGSSLARTVGTNAAAALGAQAAEDTTGEKYISPLVGAIAGGGLASGVTDLYGMLRRSLVGASDDEIRASAARVIQNTGLTPAQIDASTTNLSPLEKLQTTAERTGNAELAQIEKTLGGTIGAQEYAARAAARDEARELLLQQMVDVPSVNKEGLGTQLMKAAADTREKMGAKAKDLWELIPRWEEINIRPEQKNLVETLKRKQAGLGVNSKVKTLIDQFLDQEVGTARTSGALQDIRSDALSLLRDTNLTPNDEAILAQLQKSIDSAMSRGLNEIDSSLWSEARKATATQKGTFAQGTAGGSLTNDFARPSSVLANAFKGDAQSVKELRAAVENEPAIMQKVARGILDMVPRDAQGKVTANGLKRYLQANEGGLVELVGENKVSGLKSLIEDLRSEGRVAELAFGASRGNSVTAQKQAVEQGLKDVVVEALLPQAGPLGSLVSSIKQGAGVRDTAKLNQLLFDAAMNPQAARDLAGASTRNELLSFLPWLKRSGANLAKAGGVAGLLALGRDADATGGAKGDTSAQEIRQKAQILQGKGGSKTSAELPLQSSTAERKRTTKESAEAILSEAPASKTAITTELLGPASKQDSQAEGRSSIDRTSLSKTTQPRFSLAQLPEAIKELHPFVQAIIKVESAGNPLAESKKGAKGLMQIMPAVAKAYGIDPTDPVDNIRVGTQEISQHLERFGDARLALIAYNWGQGNLAKLIKRVGSDRFETLYPYLPSETQKYVGKVERQFQTFLEA